MYNYLNFKKGQKAVALSYDKKADDAPKVIANGKGIFAEKIIDIAKANKIPIHEDSELVEVLSLLEIDAYIPLEVYSAVAKILSFIYEQNNIKNQNKLKK